MPQERISKVVERVAEGYVLYQGFHKDVEIRVEGYLPPYSGARGTLWVKAYSGDEVVTKYLRPFHTFATARKYGRELATSLTRVAEKGRADGWAEHSEYDDHVRYYRVFNRDTGRPYWRNDKYYDSQWAVA